MPDRTCRKCGTLFTFPSTRGAARLYCSPLCARTVEADTRRASDMTAPECTVGPCALRRRSAGSPYCEMHYGRLRRNGHLDLRPRQKDSACLIDGCVAEARNKGLCKRHGERVRKHGDPLTLLYRIGDTGPMHPSWRGDDITYSGTHARTKAERGSARQHPCVDCGNGAEHWSYDYQDQAEMSSKFGPYSTDPMHYQPRCASCHKRFDQRSRPRSA